MKVYLLYQEFSYEADFLFDIFATEELAEEARLAQREPQRFYVEERDVQVGEEGTNPEAQASRYAGG